MVTVLQALRELLDPRVLQEEDGPLVLRERQPGGTFPDTKFKQTARHEIVVLGFEPRSYHNGLELDVNEWLFPLLDTRRGKPPICRSCDYIVFYMPRGSREVFVLLFELKSGSTHGAPAQLKNGWLLARYLIDVVRLHGDAEPFPEPIYRGIVLSNDVLRRKGRQRAATRLEGGGLPIMTERAGGGLHLHSFCM
ncbi:hypothetical protein [Paraliomyxa miuraensis]|uniref:hypothetical protein n=1 Tax=Paraliomyxa miuraensis TaxID=376150 RepID=UPI00225AB3B8|nr:hypothetical protein [Paraliomyxa miuraensis]MCX4248042.1 hypothetical protein [Paraliomyxa miuraensis]